MQAIERKKTISIPVEIHRKIGALRRGNQTYGEVVAECVQAMEERRHCSSLPHFEDVDIDQLIQEADEAETDFEANYISFDEAIRQRNTGKKDL